METRSFCILILPLLAIILVGLAPNRSLVAAHCKFPAIFNFGDSNSDTGGLSAVFGQASAPNGESFFHGPAGRYCDGRLIVDFIAERLGVAYLNAFLDSVGSNFTQGANFATAGSTIRAQNTTLFQSGYSPISLDVQYWEFSDFHRRSQIVRARGGVFRYMLPKKEVFSRALYTFDIGQNDLTAGYYRNMSADDVRAYVVPDVLDRFKNTVKYVYGNDGGRFFWIHNTGPVGCLAYILDNKLIKPSPTDGAGCAIVYNEVARYFNRRLKEAVVQLRKDLPEAVITYVDVYTPKYNLFTHATELGFEHPLVACCGHGGKYNHNKNVGCGGKVWVNGKQVLVGKSCSNPAVKVNWDGVHFTQAANRYIFDQIVGGSLSDPPTPLHLACQRRH